MAIALSACGQSQNALVHLTVPKGFKYVDSATINKDGYVATYLKEGENVLRFEKDGRDYAAVLVVSGGGEMYVTLEEDDFAPVHIVEEAGR